jgi:hypothetical protein
MAILLRVLRILTFKNESHMLLLAGRRNKTGLSISLGSRQGASQPNFSRMKSPGCRRSILGVNNRLFQKYLDAAKSIPEYANGKSPNFSRIARAPAAIPSIRYYFVIPELLCEVLRRGAWRAGQSLRAYMHDKVVAAAQRPTKHEAVAKIEAVLAPVTGQEPDTASVLDHLDAERR